MAERRAAVDRDQDLTVVIDDEVVRAPVHVDGGAEALGAGATLARDEGEAAARRDDRCPLGGRGQGHLAIEIEVRQRAERTGVEDEAGAPRRAPPCSSAVGITHPPGRALREARELEPRPPRKRVGDGRGEQRHLDAPCGRSRARRRRARVRARPRRERGGRAKRAATRRRRAGRLRDDRGVVLERTNAVAALEGQRGPTEPRERIVGHGGEPRLEGALGLGGASVDERAPSGARRRVDREGRSGRRSPSNPAQPTARHPRSRR
jgi:hypothetical protein